MNGITGLGDGCPVYLRSRARFIGLFSKFRSRWSFAEEIKELEALTRLRMLTSFQKKLRLNIRLYKSIVTIGHLKDTNCCTFTVLVPCSRLYSSNVQ